MGSTRDPERVRRAKPIEVLLAMALLVLSQEPPPVLSGSARALTLQVAPTGFDPLAGWLCLLGQDPVACWRGPAPLVLAAGGGVQAEDETAYLLAPVRAEGGAIQAVLELTESPQREVLEQLEESLEDEVISLQAGPLGPSLTLAEAVAGPPSVAGEVLIGRTLDDLTTGPRGLLSRLVQASEGACLAAGRPRGVTHLFPHAPAAPGGLIPLRESWLGLPSVSFVGGPLARALASLLGGTHWPARADEVLRLARARIDALVVAVEPATLEPLELTGIPRLAIAGPPRAGAGGVELSIRVRGPHGASAPPCDFLREWALAE